MTRRVFRGAASEWVAGVDEAGRGPLAGPVMAAAVILDPGRRVNGIRDSKQLAPVQRERLASRIRQRALCWSVAWADPREIDVLNILEATMLAMRRAVLGLPIRPRRIVVDGNRCPDLVDLGISNGVESVIGGDCTVRVISAASILAKETRDRFMERLHRIYPDYGFASHKGYATAAHCAALKRYGPCTVHRRSFAPVRLDQIGLFERDELNSVGLVDCPDDEKSELLQP